VRLVYNYDFILLFHGNYASQRDKSFSQLSDKLVFYNPSRLADDAITISPPTVSAR